MPQVVGAREFLAMWLLIVLWLTALDGKSNSSSTEAMIDFNKLGVLFWDS